MECLYAQSARGLIIYAWLKTRNILAPHVVPFAEEMRVFRMRCKFGGSGW